MPIYEYICDCGNTEIGIKSIDQRYDYTCICGRKMKLVPSVPYPPVIVNSIKTRITDELNEGLPHPYKKSLEKKIMGGFHDKSVIGKGF